MPKNCTLVLSSTVERFSSVDPGESGLGLTHTAPQRSDLRNSFIQEEIILRSPRIWVVPLPYTKASVPCFPVPALAPCRRASRLPGPAQTCSPPYYMCSFACSLPADCTRRDWPAYFPVYILFRQLYSFPVHDFASTGLPSSLSLRRLCPVLRTLQISKPLALRIHPYKQANRITRSRRQREFSAER